MFLFGNLSFLPDQFFQLLDFDADFATTSYADCRSKDGMLNALRNIDHIDAASSSIVEVMAGFMLYWLTAAYSSTNERVEVAHKDSFHTVAILAGGFSLIKRSVPE